MVKKLKIRIKVHPIMKEISTVHIKKNHPNCYMLSSIVIVKYCCTPKLTYQVSGITSQHS